MERQTAIACGPGYIWNAATYDINIRTDRPMVASRVKRLDSLFNC